MRIKELLHPPSGPDNIYMFTTDHQLRQLIFRSEKDFVYGINTLALGTLKYPVRILCYILMDNHLHLLVQGRYADCLAYFAWVLHRISLMLKARYGLRGLLTIHAADVQVVKDRQMLMNEVAYLLRNPYKARMSSPFSYPWSPCQVYFNPHLDKLQGTAFKSVDSAHAVLETHAAIPLSWVHWNGRVLDKCFVNYRQVEQVFGSSLVFFDRIRRYDIETAVHQAHGEEERLSFTDSEMQEKVRAICQNELHVNSHHQLSRKDLLHLARILAWRFSASKKQLARLLGIDQEVLDNAL